MKGFKSGFVAIVGRPNVGKSTLLNYVVGQKIAIITPKPQTTRNRILGILNRADGQYIFIDTPGIHQPRKLLNRYMVAQAKHTFYDSDIILFLVDATEGYGKEEELIVNALRNSSVPVLLVINKRDLVNQERIQGIRDEFVNLLKFHKVFSISALTGDGVEDVLMALGELLPEGPPYFPEDMVTDRTERFIAAEIIREKIMLLTRQEVPYAVAVLVDTFKENEQKGILHIGASIIVEKDSQKGIIIGKGGNLLKKIGTESRLALEEFFAIHVYLELFVKVRKDWTKNAHFLKELGYGEKS